jgi:nucleotide-binding universal stress UspA family protein
MIKPLKLLIAYDGSPCADEALEDLQRAGLPHEVEAVVLSVADLWLVPDSGAVASPSLQPAAMIQEAHATAAAMIDAAKARAESACERLRTHFPDWQVTAKSVAGSPAWAIVLEAEAWHADLIVVGSHGHSPLGRWLLGSVSQTVLAQASCSVRIARGRPTQPDQPLRILVGVDGSTEADSAVRMVAERVWPAGTDIRVMMVLDPSLLAAINSSPLPVEQPSDFTDEETSDRIKRVLENYKATLYQNSSDVSVSTVLMAGDPKRVLVTEAERWGADCIFIGSRGLSRWERLLLGSVSTAVATRAHCPVEVVRVAQLPSQDVGLRSV